ncbi:uncharacterized protein CBL_10830 [Carabus blaptoides fortunei]
MIARGHHGQGVGSAPVRAYERTKSPSPNRFSTDKFNISQDSGINQQTSSGSESSDYYTPPAEPYLPLQPTEPVPAKQNGHEDSFDQSDRSETPPAQQRERFINLEDSQSGSDFEDQEAKKNSEDSQDDHDFVRTQVFQKLQEEHIARVAAEEIAFRERVTESRLSKSHADLSEVKKLNRKSISSAPLVKHMKGNENHFIENKLNNNTVDEESKSSCNSSTLEVTSINQSQTELRSLNQSQLDVRSLNQSQGDLQSANTSHSDLRSINQSQGDLRSLNQSHGDLRSLNQSHGDLHSLNESQGDLYSVNQSQVDLQNRNQSQKDLHSLNQSQGDIRNLVQSQADLRNHNNQHHEIKSEVVKCPDIVKKTPKSTPKNKVELKRRSSNLPAKIQPVFPDSLRKFPKPREGMSEMISQLESPEWEMTMTGLQSLVRLIRHHPEMIEAQMHTVCVLLGRHIKNLRSQVARASCLAAAEMFTTHRKPLEMELEEIACPLLHRTADTNKFLRADANGALDAMCININTSRVMSVLSSRGATHHNAVVKCTAVRLTTELVRRLGNQKVFQLPKDTRDRMLLIGANMLTEGSLDTRKHAKSMFTELSGHPQFQRAMLEAVPASTMRHISKIINSLK